MRTPQHPPHPTTNRQQVIFASKTKNKGKLDSHCWYFDALAYLIQPEYCVLFDAGTRPLPSALKFTCQHFQRYPNVGALTGELRVERPYRTFLASVQFCEWKVSHLLQKPIESVCGFLTVLPGAFSAFRWLAVEGEPLRRYFYGLYSQARAQPRPPFFSCLLCQPKQKAAN